VSIFGDFCLIGVITPIVDCARKVL